MSSKCRCGAQVRAAVGEGWGQRAATPKPQVVVVVVVVVVEEEQNKEEAHPVL
jgi:hypothetical protein